MVDAHFVKEGRRKTSTHVSVRTSVQPPQAAHPYANSSRTHDVYRMKPSVHPLSTEHPKTKRSKGEIKKEIKKEREKTHLKLITSSSLQNVITLFASSFGTGKRNFNASPTLLPNRLPNFSKIKCGYCSETVLSL